MSWFMVDVESDGPVPPLYSMICFGAIRVDENLELAPTFYGQIKPISSTYIPAAQKVSGFNRVQHNKFDDPIVVMRNFADWILQVNVGRPMFISDNNGYDWQWINYYFHKYIGDNPFGYSSTNLGSLYKGRVGDMRKNFKHLRKTTHTHNPVDDARGNAEALLEMIKRGLKLNL